MAPLEKLLDRPKRVSALITSAALIAAIALADWRTTPYLSLGFLYLLPIIIAAGFLPRPGLMALGVLCAVLSETFSGLDPAGRVSRLIFETLALGGSGLFVSELLRNRRLSLETQQRLRALVETSPAAIVTMHRCGVIDLANQAATEMLASSGASLIGQPIGTFVPELQNASFADGATQFRASMRCQVHRSNGESFAAEVWFSTYKEKAVAKLAAIIADVSEEQRPGPPACAGEKGAGERALLTGRQVTVLQLVLEGLANNEIASRLEMTSSAVKNTMQQLFSKMGAHNRSQMVRVALERYRDLL